MFETIMVRGVEYPPDHKHYPIHTTSPRGPLVQVPGTRAQDQKYIGHRRVKIPATEQDHPTRKGVKIRVVSPDVRSDGVIPTKLQAVEVDGKFEARMVPSLYRWEYDPTPLKVVLIPENDYIRRAVARGDIEQIKGETKKPKRGES